MNERNVYMDMDSDYITKIMMTVIFLRHVLKYLKYKKRNSA